MDNICKCILKGKIRVSILILGNGFDLAQSLTTVYGDFLMFIEILKK